MKVYLAGPHMDDQFRAAATELLEGQGVTILDPIKARDFRGKEIANEADIVAGDLADIVACDAVFGKYSIPGWGTGMETWFAYSIGRPVIAYVGKEARVSPWVAYVARGYDNVHRDLNAACEAVVALLPRHA